MSKSLPVLAFIFVYIGPGAAVAMSVMPNGEGNPYPSLFALLSAVGLLALCFVIVDLLEQVTVERMRRDNDVGGLIGALKKGWLSRKAACALGDMKAESAIGPLAEALHDKNSDVRQAAAKALGDIGDPGAEDALLQALGDRYAGVRECATSSLKKLKKADNTL